MPQLHEVVAARSARQKALYELVIQLANKAKKSDNFTGIKKTYEPYDEEGRTYPPEAVHVKLRAADLVREGRDAFKDLINLTATNDQGNLRAKADIEIDGTPLAKDVPVTTLMYLEKLIKDLRDFVRALPKVDAGYVWSWDETNGLFRTEPRGAVKTRKDQVPVVLYEATKEHPAQVQLVSKDIEEGTWLTTYFTSALRGADASAMLARVEALSVAIKQARERANTVETPVVNIAGGLLDYVFSTTTP